MDFGPTLSLISHSYLQVIIYCMIPSLHFNSQRCNNCPSSSRIFFSLILSCFIIFFWNLTLEFWIKYVSLTKFFRALTKRLLEHRESGAPGQNHLLAFQWWRNQKNEIKKDGQAWEAEFNSESIALQPPREVCLSFHPSLRSLYQQVRRVKGWRTNYRVLPGMLLNRVLGLPEYPFLFKIHTYIFFPLWVKTTSIWTTPRGMKSQTCGMSVVEIKWPPRDLANASVENKHVILSRALFTLMLEMTGNCFPKLWPEVRLTEGLNQESLRANGLFVCDSPAN